MPQTKERLLLNKDIVLKYLVQHSKLDYETGCFLWKGATVKGGYGWVNIVLHEIPYERRGYQVHRLALWIFDNLELDGDMHVLHAKHCHNINCWAPRHIRIGTHQENMLEAVSLGLGQKGKTHCHRGHEFTPENIYLYRGKRHCRTCRSVNSKHDRALLYKDFN